MDNLLLLPLQRFRPTRYRPGGLGTWSGHLPFANDLVAALRPSVIVELGSHFGESYFGFCQAVVENGISGRCFAVDTWRGDEHAGFYDEGVFEEVSAHNEAEYGALSTLLRMTFDEAAGQFAPESIDLLHIDGLHTYGAVKDDFETWFPKVRPGGIVLLHDVGVRHGDFEVWRFWEELARQYPHFEFHHWWGLGVLRKPGGTSGGNSFIDLLLNADVATAARIRQQYEDAAELLESRERSPEERQAAADADRPYLQIFPGNVKLGFLERESTVSNIEAGVWQIHVARLPHGAPNGLIRVDPVNRTASLELSRVTVRDGQGTVLLELEGDALAELPFADGLIPIGHGESVRHFSWSDDPRFVLRLPSGMNPDMPMLVEITMRVEFTLERVRAALELAGTADSGQLETDLEMVRKQAAVLQATIVREQNRRTRLEWDYSFAQTQREHLEADLKQSRGELDAKDRTIQHLQAQIAEQQVRVAEMSRSLSWKATAPLRALAGPFRGSGKTVMPDPPRKRR